VNTQDEKIVSEINRLSSQLSAHPSARLYGAAKFWESHSAKHSRLLADYGFEKFKRTINFEYNQWGVRSLRDEKIRYLAMQLLRNGRLPLGPLWTRVDTAAMSDVRWSDEVDQKTGQALGKADPKGLRARLYPYAYALYVGLLWQYALLKDDFKCLAHCEEPTLGAPLPITYKGKLVSQDLALSSLELNRIARYVPINAGMRIAEIGAGCGRLAYLAVRMIPKVRYFIFDIPPAVVIAKHYLSQTLGVEKVRATFDMGANVQNSEIPLTLSLSDGFEDIPEHFFDLAINISSFDEMAPEQVANYLSLIDKKCKGFLYVKGYTHSRSSGSRLGVQEFPYPTHWVQLYSGVDPVVPKFSERIYRLR
jgi:putative sugar O-methyltransferase